MSVDLDRLSIPDFSFGDAWRARFAIGARRAVEHWMDYVRRHKGDLSALQAESSNILHGIREAADVPGAWTKATDLAIAFRHFMENRGSWRHWAKCLTGLVEAPAAHSHPVLRARLRHVLATALARLGQIDAAVEQLKAAITPLREGRAWNPLAEVLLAIAYWRVGAGQRAGIDAYLREAESLAARFHNQPVLIDVHHIRGRLALQDGRHADAIAAFQRALELACGADHRPLEKAARNFLAMACLEAEQPDAALPHLWRALDIARATGDRPGIGVVLINVGRAYLGLDQPRLAVTHLQASLRMTRRTDNRPAECAALTTLGDVYCALDRVTLAEGCYRQALHLARSLDDARREVRVLEALAAL